MFKTFDTTNIEFFIIYQNSVIYIWGILFILYILYIVLHWRHYAMRLQLKSACRFCNRAQGGVCASSQGRFVAICSPGLTLTTQFRYGRKRCELGFSIIVVLHTPRNYKKIYKLYKTYKVLIMPENQHTTLIILTFKVLKICFFFCFEVFGLFEMYCCIVGVLCIINCYF